jgi:CrcB protein
MIELLSVAVGGFFGAICRFGLSRSLQKKRIFPIGTLAVNLTGAFLLGLLAGIQLKGNGYLLLGIGFMGAFTTFSTFKLESEQ